MWNEVFLESNTTDKSHATEAKRSGHWVTVDCTTNEVGNAPLLLKFIDSPTVMGTQPIRWRLTDSLKVSVKDFTIRKSDSSHESITELNKNAYTNSEYRFRVSSPTEQWEIRPKVNNGNVTIQFQKPGMEEEGVLIHCVAAALPVAMKAKALTSLRDNRFSAMYHDYKSSRQQEQINGRRWEKLAFTRSPGPNESKKFPEEKKMKTTEYLLQQGRILYLVNLIAPQASHDKYSNELARIVESLKLQESKEDE